MKLILVLIADIVTELHWDLILGSTINAGGLWNSLNNVYINNIKQNNYMLLK